MKNNTLSMSTKVSNKENKVQITCMAVLAILAIVAGMVVGCGKDPGGGGEVTKVETEINSNAVSEDTADETIGFATAEERMNQKKPTFYGKAASGVGYELMSTYESGKFMKIDEVEVSDDYFYTGYLGARKRYEYDGNEDANYDEATGIVYEYGWVDGKDTCIRCYDPVTGTEYELGNEPKDHAGYVKVTGTLYEVWTKDPGIGGKQARGVVFFPCDIEEWRAKGYVVNVTENYTTYLVTDDEEIRKSLDWGGSSVGIAKLCVTEDDGVIMYTDHMDLEHDSLGLLKPGMYGMICMDSDHATFFLQYLLKNQIPDDVELEVIHE